MKKYWKMIEFCIYNKKPHLINGLSVWVEVRKTEERWKNIMKKIWKIAPRRSTILSRIHPSNGVDDSFISIASPCLFNSKFQDLVKGQTPLSLFTCDSRFSLIWCRYFWLLRKVNKKVKKLNLNTLRVFCLLWFDVALFACREKS